MSYGRALAATLVGIHATFALAQPAPTEQPAQRYRHYSVSASVDVPLAYDDPVEGEGSQGEESVRSPRISLGFRYSPRDPWFARITAYHYLNEERKAQWNPDFTYSFGYDDWRPGTLAITYDNYGGNRFSPDRAAGEKMTRFEEGTLSAVYKVPVPERVDAFFNPHPDRRLSATLGAHFTPRFRRNDDPVRGEWKQVVSAGIRNRFYSSWYVEARALFYPRDGQQQPWDPDFTYGFGYFDWRPGKISVQYSNYAPNRFRGHDVPRGGTFRDGAIAISWSNSW
jgi:hypothetical protein